MKKGVLRNFTKFTGKLLCQSLFFSIKLACNFIKKEALAQMFPVNFVKFLRTPFLQIQIQPLILSEINKLLFPLKLSKIPIVF